MLAISTVSMFGGEPAKPRTANVTADTLVRFKRSDFRTVFCAYQTLQSRVGRGVAFIDDPFGKSVEIQLERNTTVAAVMQRAGLQFQKREPQTQLRLITKDAIYQSPSTSDKSLQDAFGSREVQPGDILVTTVVD